MKRLVVAFMIFISAAAALPALAGNQSNSFQVSVRVVPPMEERVSAPAPTAGFQPMHNDQGDHWIVQAPAVQAIEAYAAQLHAAGFRALDAAGTHWSDGRTALMISAREAISATPVSRLSVLAYDVRRSEARIAAARAQANPAALLAVVD